MRRLNVREAVLRLPQRRALRLAGGGRGDLRRITWRLQELTVASSAVEIRGDMLEITAVA
jgi:hypothetical protein